MVSIPKVVGVRSCGFLLSLGLSNVTQAADEKKADQSEMKTDQSDRRQSGQAASEKQMSEEMRGKTVKGEVLRVESDIYFVKGQDGKEVRMYTDKTTIIMGNIRQGDRIEATVNDQNHALSIRSAP